MSETTTPTTTQEIETTTPAGGGGDQGGGAGASAPATANTASAAAPAPAPAGDDLVKSLRSEAAKYRTERNELQERLNALDAQVRETQRQVKLSRALYVAAVEEDADIELLDGYAPVKDGLSLLDAQTDNDLNKQVREIVKAAIKAKPSLKKSRAVSVGASSDGATVKPSKNDPLRSVFFR
jgi:hypothetical protein